MLTTKPQPFTIKKAVNRLINRFTKTDKPVRVYEEDVTALREIAKGFNFFFDDTKHNHNLYYKLILRLIFIELNHSRNWKVAVRSVFSELKSPIELQECKIRLLFDDIKCQNLIKSFDFPEDFGSDEELETKEKLKALNEENKTKLVDKLSSVISQEEVNEVLYELANDVFVEFSNKN